MVAAYLRPSVTSLSAPPTPSFAERSRDRILAPFTISRPPWARKLMYLSASLVCGQSVSVWAVGKHEKSQENHIAIITGRVGVDLDIEYVWGVGDETIIVFTFS